MRTLHIFNTKKVRGCTKLLPCLLFVLITVAGCVNWANAQRNNLSDWNVPPPLPPGTITKGDNTGKPGTAKPALVITDVQAPSQPDATAVQLPYLAMSSIPPDADVPEQPILDAKPGLPELPLPQAPDTPPLPKQSIQDASVQQLIDLPMPDAPDMPELPAEPASSGPVTGTKTNTPVMPDVVGINTLSLPAVVGLALWSTPAIPENINFRLVTMPAAKSTRYRGKALKKVKPQLQKN